MRQGNSSETLLEPATPYIAFDDEQTGVEVADHRDTTRRGISRAALHLAYVNPDAASMTSKSASDHQTVWSKILNSRA